MLIITAEMSTFMLMIYVLNVCFPCTPSGVFGDKETLNYK